MKDYLVKALGFNGQIRAYAAQTTAVIQEAQRRHDTWRTASAALGRAMTAGVMMGAMQKGEIKLNIRIEGDGPLGSILVDTNAHGDVRGYVRNPHTDLERKYKGKLNVSGAVGTNGTLSVVRDLGLKENFNGQVPLISGELAEDFTYYFTVSEQTPSSVALGVLVNPDDTIAVAGGFIIQVMPNASEEVIQFLENRLAQMSPVTTLMSSGATPERLLAEIFGEEELQILETMPVQFRCSCSKERISGALMTIGKTDLQQIIEEDGQAAITCHFCNEQYHFEKTELEALYNAANQTT